MAGSLEGKVVLVTGGGSGIGRATSLLIAKQGAKLMIADYVPAGAEKTVAMIKEAGGAASCLAADVLGHQAGRDDGRQDGRDLRPHRRRL